MVTKLWWWRKRWKPGRSVTLQSLKVFEILLCSCLYIVGYSWECGRLLVKICHDNFWFCGIFTDRMVSKIFWCHWLYKRSKTFAGFSQKLQWFNTNTQFSIYSIWNIYSPSKTLAIQKMNSEWKEVLSVDYLNSFNCSAKLEELQKVIPYHSEKYKPIILNVSSFQRTIYHLQHRSSLLHHFLW